MLPLVIFAFFHAVASVEKVLEALGRTALAGHAKALGVKSKTGFRMAANTEILALVVLVLSTFRQYVPAFVFAMFASSVVFVSLPSNPTVVPFCFIFPKPI